jgi:predicted phage terminase large subunit-like protein
MSRANKAGYSPATLQAIAQAAKYELARKHYVDYVQLVHHGRWQRARHLDLICSELEKVISGDTKRLMIFLPPRHGKSMSVTKTFPSYFLGKFPDKRVIEVSYGSDLATEFGVSNRDKVAEFGSPIFGIELSSVQATKTDWNIEYHQGGMLSVGIGGGITGKGADLLIIDDPIKNREDAESEATRAMIMREWQSTLYPRLQPGAAIIIILTRWHEADLVAKLLKPDEGEPENWRVISLSCICDSENDLLGRKIGQALWPEYGFDEVWAQRTKKTVGSYAWSSLYQQKPTPAGGSIFKREWMNKTYKKLPDDATLILSWDLPFKNTESSAKCAGIAIARSGANYYFVDVLNEKMEFTENITAMLTMSAKHPKARAKVVEDKANGPAVINTLKDRVSGIVPFNPQGSKEDRARAVSPYFEAGNIFLPEEAQWKHDFINDLVSFPNGEFKDTVDATTQGILYLDKLLGTVGGLIYRAYASDPAAYAIDSETIKAKLKDGGYLVNVGIYLGGTMGGTSLVATAMSIQYDSVIVLHAERYSGDSPASSISSLFAAFTAHIDKEYCPITYTYYVTPDDDTVLYRAIRASIQENSIPVQLRAAQGSPEIARIRLTNGLLDGQRLRIGPSAGIFAEALLNTQWDSKRDVDTRLTGTGIDTGTLEAFEATIERDARRFMEANQEGRKDVP